jgi:GT2 family glycosyltransferase
MTIQPDYRATVIIINWNGKRLLPDTLYALRLQTESSFHTIIVDNGSCDGSVEFIRREFPGIEVIALGWNSGFAFANNVAIKRVQTPYTILLNNDAVPSKNWVGSLIKALETHPSAGLAASKMLFFDNPNMIDRVGDAFTNAGVAKLRGRKEQSNCYNKAEWIFGACAGAAMYRTSAIKEVGGFDEDFFLINEDVDLSFRLQSRGYKCLYIPEAVVYHKASSSIVHDSATSVYYGHRNLEWVYLKNLPVPIILKTLPTHLVYIMLAFVFFISKGHGRTYIHAKIDAMAAVPKILRKRREIQSQRCVAPRYLASLMIPERFFERRTIRKI